MLSDEEKNAIEWLKSKINEYVIKSELDENIEIILNLIENLIFKTETQKELLKYKTDKIKKQSQEIEHQKEKRENQKKELAILNAKQNEFNKLVNTVNSYKGQFKRQQKKIKELKEECKEVVCVPEGTCFMIEPKNVDKKWEDKIKAKIEEYRHKDFIKMQVVMKHDKEALKIAEVLQSLLEKE